MIFLHPTPQYMTSMPVTFLCSEHEKEASTSVQFTVEHHVHVNDPRKDAEKASGMAPRSGSISWWNIVRATPLDPCRLHHRLQHIIVFVYNSLLYSPIHMLMVLSRLIPGVDIALIQDIIASN